MESYPASSAEVTRLLGRMVEQDEAARERLLALVYDELHALATRCFLREDAGHTLQPTALVHEAYLKLVDQRTGWNDRAHFYAVAATCMRRILVSYARRRNAQKRGGGGDRLELEGLDLAPELVPGEIQALDEALERLARLDPRKARVVELRFFGGLEREEIAEVLGVSVATVRRDWAFSRAWLATEVRGEDGVGEG